LALSESITVYESSRLTLPNRGWKC
jgi:hypothetical protein